MQKNSNLAYDFARFEPERKQSVAVEKKTEIKVVKKTARRASPAKIIVMLAAVLAIASMMIYNQVVLTELNDQTTTLNTELEKLQSEKIQKSTELESQMSLKNIEEYTVNNLGLVKMDQSQVEYVDLESGNKVEVKQQQDDSFWGSIKQAFQNLLEYLG